MLNNGQIRLRALATNDAELLVKWRFAEQNYDYFYEYRPVSVEQNADWIKSAVTKNSEINFIAEDVKTHTPFGMIALVDIDMRNQKCEMGRVLIGEEKDRKAGYGKQMIDLLLEYAFYHLNLRKVYCEVFADNTRAVNFYKKIGFEQDGIFKDHIYKSGAFKDVLHMSLTKQNFTLRK